MADPVSPLLAAPSPIADEMTFEQWLLEVRLSVAEANHMRHVHDALNQSSTGTAESFAELLDATRKARV